MIVILPVLSFLYNSLSAGLAVQCIRSSPFSSHTAGPIVVLVGLAVQCITNLLHKCDSHTAGLVVPIDLPFKCDGHTASLVIYNELTSQLIVIPPVLSFLYNSLSQSCYLLCNRLTL